MIVPVKGGVRIKHCKSGKKGFIKATPKPISRTKAVKIHRAIMANKKKSSKVRKQIRKNIRNRHKK